MSATPAAPAPATTTTAVPAAAATMRTTTTTVARAAATAARAVVTTTTTAAPVAATTTEREAGPAPRAPAVTLDRMADAEPGPWSEAAGGSRFSGRRLVALQVGQFALAGLIALAIVGVATSVA